MGKLSLFIILSILSVPIFAEQERQNETHSPEQKRWVLDPTQFMESELYKVLELMASRLSIRIGEMDKTLKEIHEEFEKALKEAEEKAKVEKADKEAREKADAEKYKKLSKTLDEVYEAAKKNQLVGNDARDALLRLKVLKIETRADSSDVVKELKKKHQRTMRILGSRVRRR